MDTRKSLVKGRILTLFLILVALSLPLQAADRYPSVLKKWTRHDKVYVWDNFEARLIWRATYLSEPFREARRKKMVTLYEWEEDLVERKRVEDQEEERKYDTFFVAIYAGSSQWPEVGKETGQWKIVLKAGKQPPVEAVRFEKISITSLERILYPYLGKWDGAYFVRFPKTIEPGEPFQLRMTGLPAHSQLVWK